MISTFSDRLITEIENKKSHVCVGLDPRLENIPKHIINDCIKNFGPTPEAVAESFFLFNKKIIDAVKDHACSIKIQIAFYEQYGYLGVKSFKKTIDYAKEKRLIVIGDVKRNDIGSTVKAYSLGYLGRVLINDKEQSIFDVDCITTNPYFGSDGILPFIEDIKKYHKGIFVLVRTSNKSAIELQDLKINKRKLYEIVGELVNKWGQNTSGIRGYSSVGAVVGATYAKEAKKLRKLMPNVYFLVPGYGAQGATAKDVVECFNKDGLGAIVNSARDIIFAYQKQPWKNQFSEYQFDEAARAATINMKNEINIALGEAGIPIFS